jgi:hypothetical protein
MKHEAVNGRTEIVAAPTRRWKPWLTETATA